VSGAPRRVILTLTCAASLLYVGTSLASPPESVPLVERGQVNRLTSSEVAAGYRLLFDGVTGTGWRGVDSEDFPSEGWSIKNGILSIRDAGMLELRAGGDLFSVERFGDFVFDFEFRLSEGANSGVKYRAEVQRQFGFVHSLGCEYQILDDARHPDARRGHEGNRRLASLYDVIPARDVNGSAPGGEPKRWHHGRIHLESEHLAHYLNGVRVLAVKFDSEAWKSAVAESKFADRPDFCSGPRGHIVLQDHGNHVQFRNLRIRTLDRPGDDS